MLKTEQVTYRNVSLFTHYLPQMNAQFNTERRHLPLVSYRSQKISVRFLHDFPQPPPPPPKNAGRLSRLVPDLFLSNPVEFISHPISVHYVVCFADCDTKLTVNCGRAHVLYHLSVHSLLHRCHDL